MSSGSVGLFVCPRCFTDNALRDFIESAAIATTCSFCGARAKKRFAAPLDDVAGYIKDCLRADYDDPANWLMYVGSEGGYQGITYTTRELLAGEIGLELPRDHDDRLIEALVDAIDKGGPEVWCERNPYGLPETDQLQLSWDRFAEFVKHKRRYFFRGADQPATRNDPFDEILSPDDLLARIAGRAVDLDLITKLPARTSIYRARFQPPGSTFDGALELGPPPPDKAKQNRMSPAGVAMFYGCEDMTTAIAETVDQLGDYAVGEFRLVRDSWVLDLHDLPAIPSFFSEIDAWKRAPMRFLHSFAREIAKPIERDDSVHIEYVPTQVMTEYFRTQFKWEGRVLDGICYTSSHNPGHRSYVLFAEREDLRLDESASLKLDPDGRERQAAAWLELVKASTTRHEG